MKLLSIIALYSLFLSLPESNCIITQNGINDIVIDSSHFKEVTPEFGIMKSSKEWQSSVEMELFGSYKYIKTFPNEGIVFYAEREKGKKIINDIVLTEGCICKTEDGIGVGSSYQDLSNAFGQPYFNNDKRKPSIRYEPNMYIKLTKGERVLQITYNNFHITMSSTDTTVSKIKKIRVL